MTPKSICVGFEPVSRSDARVLVLGTLPSAESLKQGQYYAKKQNSFWKLMGVLVGASPDMPYEDRLKRLKDSGIALWDVCAAAQREGSLDADIQFSKANDFVSFFEKHPDIKLICFNGQHAEKLFCRDVKPSMPEKVLLLPRIALPSTSPAHAGIGFEQKLSHWRDAFEEFLR